MKVSLIAAVSRNRVIGRDGRLPWHLPEDLKRFKATTLGHPIVMGRKTYESFKPPAGRPLPGRTNIVMSRSPRPAGLAPEVEWVPSLDEAIARARSAAHLQGELEVFIIGGAEIYRLALPRADRLYLTEIDKDVEGDAWFPKWDPAEFRLVRKESCAEPFSHAYCLWERR